MQATEIDPIFWWALLWLLTGEIIAVLDGGLAGLLVGALTVDANDAATERKTSRQRFSLTTTQSAVFDAAVADGGLDKKGVSLVRACAYCSNEG